MGTLLREKMLDCVVRVGAIDITQPRKLVVGVIELAGAIGREGASEMRRFVVRSDCECPVEVGDRVLEVTERIMRPTTFPVCVLVFVEID